MNYYHIYRNGELVYTCLTEWEAHEQVVIMRKARRGNYIIRRSQNLHGQVHFPGSQSN